MTRSSCECAVNRETENRQERKNRKGHTRARESEWKREEGADSEEWRPLKISAKRSVITEGGRQTASFLLLQQNKDTNQFKSTGHPSLTSFCQTPGGEGVFLPPLITEKKRTPLQGHPG